MMNMMVPAVWEMDYDYLDCKKENINDEMNEYLFDYLLNIWHVYLLFIVRVYWPNAVIWNSGKARMWQCDLY